MKTAILLLWVIVIAGYGEEVVEEADVVEAETQTGGDALVWDAQSRAYPERGFAVPLPRTTREKSLLVVIDHRLNKTFTQNTFRDWFGFDGGGLKVGLSLRLGLFKDFDLGVQRLNGVFESFDTYDFDGRYRFFSEEKNGFDLALGAGATWFFQADTDDASGVSGKLLVGKSFGRHLYVSTGGMGHSSSTYATKKTDDLEYSLAVPLVLSSQLTEGKTLLFESMVPVYGYTAGKPSWSFGYKMETHKHTFSFLITNTQYITSDGLVSGSDRLGDPVFAFSITRELSL